MKKKRLKKKILEVFCIGCAWLALALSKVWALARCRVMPSSRYTQVSLPRTLMRSPPFVGNTLENGDARGCLDTGRQLHPISHIVRCPSEHSLLALGVGTRGILPQRAAGRAGTGGSATRGFGLSTGSCSFCFTSD